MKKVIFLDRDGTIIVDKVYLNDPDGIEYLPGVEEALKLLNSKGYEFVIVTNQSGVPRGIVSLENLDTIHRRIKSHFETHGIHFLSFHFAPYMTDSNHEMRKPNAGMLKEASEMHGISFSESWMIGDRMTDVEAG
ncbi:MAG: HAD family hydrolase, partial [Bdellovibrionales bacterium]|nr:HAD family hydrolase [Bdellovibrionales bacterium]